jgi:hypothetical protein
MKTLSLILVVLFLGMASTSDAGIQPKTKKKAVPISLTEAMQNPQLCMSIHFQVDPSQIVTGLNQQTYTAKVICHDVTYYVTGTIIRWKWFFRVNIVPVPAVKAKLHR